MLVRKVNRRFLLIAITTAGMVIGAPLLGGSSESRPPYKEKEDKPFKGPKPQQPVRIAPAKIFQKKELAKSLNPQAIEFTKKLLDNSFLLPDPDKSSGSTVIWNTAKLIATTANYAFTPRIGSNPAYLDIKSCDATELAAMDFSGLFRPIANVIYLNPTSPECHAVATRVEFKSLNSTTNVLLVQATTLAQTNDGPAPLVLQAEVAFNPCIPDTGDTSIAKFGMNGPYESPFAVLGAVRLAMQARGISYPGFATDSPIVRSVGASGGGFRWTSDGTILTAELTEVCSILGYKEYVSSTCLDDQRAKQYGGGKCNFHSPGDNSLMRVDPAGKKFRRVAADPKYGQTWLSSITCKGKLNFCK